MSGSSRGKTPEKTRYEIHESDQRPHTTFGSNNHSSSSRQQMTRSQKNQNQLLNNTHNKKTVARARVQLISTNYEGSKGATRSQNRGQLKSSQNQARYENRGQARQLAQFQQELRDDEMNYENFDSPDDMHESMICSD